jgi:hypothetical protein
MLLAATTLALTVVPTGLAQANWYYTKAGAERLAKDFVSKHYADTYKSDLTTYCTRPGGVPASPDYKYHRLDCAWADASDGTSGVVRIIGSSRGLGAYYGVVLRGAR